ncbi:redox-sensitive transcriptional activator SoxR [Aurantiacibacter flavus]|uniref:Redox-sensitive transcriptional activator SoxR n=1 Tax=Aurantiacibacter flavus TaxID=3145232 RepID=A0ABV0CSF0_9SPHN
MATAAQDVTPALRLDRHVTKNDIISIGQLAARTGVAVSALRFYEDKGLIRSIRTNGNQRRFLRSDIRRVSFVLIAQKLGLSLTEIEEQLAALPQGRTPSVLDWRQLSQRMRAAIDEKITLLTRTRAKLDDCIGCGCMSLDKCQLYNKDDRMGMTGTGPRMVLD